MIMDEKTMHKVDYIETCINNIQNFIQIFRDGGYEDEDDFFSDIGVNAADIYNQAMSHL